MLGSQPVSLFYFDFDGNDFNLAETAITTQYAPPTNYCTSQEKKSATNQSFLNQTFIELENVIVFPV